MGLRPLLVVNPRSGGGRTGKTFGSIRPAIESALGPVDVELTERPGHGIELASAGVLAGHPLVVAVGGDGTFNEVCNGVMAAGEAGRETRVGLIAQGTGGDFRRTLGIDHRLEHYLEALSSGRERKMDVGRFRYRAHDGGRRERYFVNILSAGMGGLVDQYVARAPAAVGGKAAYFLASLGALASCRVGRLRCQTTRSGKTEDRRIATYLIAICNGRYFGSGMKVAPMAAPDDGAFEVVSLGAPSKVAFALSSRKIYSGAHLGDPGVEHFACDRIDLDLENEEAREVFLLDVDGEPLGGLPVSIELVPGALTLRA
ncbi:MAG: diacylglycerol kinase family lipid kinase [Deltaproteobacteria bacterium]|nr:diacylglycerol kinase family lipid kinase [Deltaproteobacteria bacterium]